MHLRQLVFAITVVILTVFPSVAHSQDHVLHTFERQQLTATYFSEGANAGDVNGDGIADVVYGPYWFAGPDYTAKHEIYKPAPQDVNGYADNFFNWLYDFNGDGRNDVFVVGFPGSPAYVYENPGTAGFGAHWKKHQVFDWVSNESPQWINIAGDETPELVCTRDGFFGFATVNWNDAFGTWDFHPISEQIASTKFGHGLGIGDINGDARMDIIHAGGWFEQPVSHALTSRWLYHETSFSQSYGGAEMYAYDVDGDGDNDVITSHSAHNFGLGWYEQIAGVDEPKFTHHLIMGEHPSENKYGVLFSEPHSVALADIDGDGLKDIITGKTYWSHHNQSPMWDAGAVVYWFRLVRGKDGVDWIPYKADGESGIGRQISIVDVNNDNLPDIVVGGMRGSHVLTQKRRSVSKVDWQSAQPRVYDGEQLPSVEDAEAIRGSKSKIDEDTGRVAGAIEGESLKANVTGGQAKAQDMSRFNGDKWSNKSQLWWTGGRIGDKLTLDLPAFTGTVDVDVVLSIAADYGIVQLSLDDQQLGDPIDLYNGSVATTGVLSFAKLAVQGNRHTLTAQIVGTNPKAKKSFMFALDYLRIKRSDGTFVAGRAGQATVPATVKATLGIAPMSMEGKVLNLDFETGTLVDWTATGNAFEGQPIKGDTVTARGRGMKSGHSGEFWIGGFELHGDDRIGTLTSAPLMVSQPYGSFLANGGPTEKTRIELVRKDTGKVFYQIAGTTSETLRQVVVDLRAHVGKEIMIRLVDASNGAWGHLNFDHFRLHEDRPAPITIPPVELVQDEYPHAGLSAIEAAAAMKLPDGFSVTVAAAEPDVQQPIAMAIDDRGRVWIAEAYEYPNRAIGDAGRDRILIFEDTDGNGTLDKRKVFKEGLNLVSGLEVGFGGAWVGAAPYLMFIPDKDGDDVPDSEPQILLDGWGYQDTHETLNAFIWGPDGWLYGCHGVFTHSRVGKPGTPDEGRVPLNCAVWRYHPTRHEFDIFAHGTSNPWGVDFNDHGQAFITACVIPHLYHMIQGGRYQRQGGQHFNKHTYSDIVTIADHLHYLGATPHGGNSKSDTAGGGHAHAGAMIYLGDTWPEEYRNQLFMNNIHGQRLNMDTLKPNGSGYIGSHGPDFLLTGDQASQILNIRSGPDGDAWMIDWYDMQACHRNESEVHDRSNGRIYKIEYNAENAAPASIVSSRKIDAGTARYSVRPASLAAASDLQLAELVLDSNDWYVRHARRHLHERAHVGHAISIDAMNKLNGILTSHTDETRRLRAAWALHVIGELHPEQIRTMLTDDSPYVRGWAIQLATETIQSSWMGLPPTNERLSSEVLAQFTRLAREDSSPIVRLYLASVAQKIPVEQRWDLLQALMSHPEDATDHTLPLMYWYAAEPLAEVDASRALALAMEAGEHVPLLRDYMLRRIGSSDAGSSLVVLVKGLGGVKSESLQLTYLKAIRAALQGQRQVAAPSEWAAVSTALLKSSNTEVQLQATALGVTFGDVAAMQVMRRQVEDSSGTNEDRLVALQSLLDANDAGLVPTLHSLLKTSGALRDSAIRGLAQYDDPIVASALLAAYATFTPDQKRMALGTLCSRSASGVTLLKAIESKQLSGTDLTADLVRQLQFLKSDDVNLLLKSVWGTVRESAADKLAMIAELKALVVSSEYPEANVDLGRAVYSMTCLKCHVLYGVGNKIGPDLTGSNRSNIDYLLSNIVDPSAVMAKEYRPTVIATVDGRVITGLVKVEDAKSVTLQTSDAVVIVPKDEIDERVESEKSMMPDDQLKQFTPHHVRSLVAYLQTKQQTPMLATKDNASTIFNGQDLTGWSGAKDLWAVENGELVGRTEGLQRNEWIVSDLSVDNFHFTVEVKLVDNEGNSGIQFRSAAKDGEVSGYQADIGKGWWGKLYEEHGRALLWDKSAEQHVKFGDWNTYEIIADRHVIRALINSQPCFEIEDSEGALRGIIAFQLHSGGRTEVRFRNMKLDVFAQEVQEPAAAGR